MTRLTHFALILSAGIFTPISVFAADLATPPSDELVVAGGWDGFYLGTDLAYGMGTTAITLGPIAKYDGTGSEGASFGAFAGYNFSFDNWVSGFEAFGAWSDLNGHTELTVNGDSGSIKTSTDWNAGISARLGRLVSPQTLVFAGVGGKVYHGQVDVTGPDDSTIYSEDDQFMGVGTVTVGVETQLGGNWRARVQYDADFLRYNDYDGLRIDPTIGTAKASLIYAFGDAAQTVELTSAADQWTGFYAGINLGQSQGVAALEYAYDDDALRYDGFGSRGWSGGLAAGANLRIGDRFVLGVEGDYTTSSLATKIGSADGTDYFVGRNSSWIDAKLKAGYLTSDSTLLYGFVGASRVTSDLALVIDGSVQQSGDEFERNGITVGGGIETWIGNNVSIRGEYSYTALEAMDLSDAIPDGAQFDLQQNQQSATVGVLYHF
jgi:outer membrane immunogenic protein